MARPSPGSAPRGRELGQESLYDAVQHAGDDGDAEDNLFVARDLIAYLRTVIRPVMTDAECRIRERVGDEPIHRHHATVKSLTDRRLGMFVAVQVVHLSARNYDETVSVAIGIRRDGRLAGHTGGDPGAQVAGMGHVEGDEGSGSLTACSSRTARRILRRVVTHRPVRGLASRGGSSCVLQKRTFLRRSEHVSVIPLIGYTRRRHSTPARGGRR